jgi:hypothetical protein
VATLEVNFLHPFAEVLVFLVLRMLRMLRMLQRGVQLEDHHLSSFSLQIMMNYYSFNYSIT